MKKISLVYILSITGGFYASAIMKADETIQKEIRYKEQHKKIETITTTVENTYEYEWLSQNTDKDYDTIQFVNKERSPAHKRIHTKKSPSKTSVKAPPVPPRPLSTFTSTSAPVSREPSVALSITSDTFSLDPAACARDDSSLFKLFEPEPEYEAIPNDIQSTKDKKVEKPKRRDPKKDPLPSKPEEKSYDNRIYERVKDVKPSPFSSRSHRPFLRQAPVSFIGIGSESQSLDFSR